ncbi:aldose epimerase [Paraburkholderia sp. CNPSo 3157]|uniref:Aldose epimerase n=1 Tax=Paraburkholderia franconis TaxID=2654983 RepID=A0A7X1TFU7_9BURK|nr:aldose epimerase [Paraburkholderia franconis]MPW17757.1 aldose epimerase [Paraburkholderia franconis]
MSTSQAHEIDATGSDVMDTTPTVIGQTNGASHFSSRATLANAYLKLEVLPGLGGGISRFDWNDRGIWTPVFVRPSMATSGVEKNQLACYPLLQGPWIRRRQSHLPKDLRGTIRNCAEERDLAEVVGLQDWQIERIDARSVKLTAVSAIQKAYHAILEYQLDGPTLTVKIQIENRKERAVPFSIGIRPFLIRDADTLVCAPASSLRLSGDGDARSRYVPTPPAWQFGVTYPLPRSQVDHVFKGWGGRALFEWPTRQFSLEISSDAASYRLHAPRQERFFSFQPYDALDGATSATGVHEGWPAFVHAGARMSRRFNFTVGRIGSQTKFGMHHHVSDGRKAVSSYGMCGQ